MSKAFTLIEILVCIGIIAVLCAITFPMLAAAKMSAKVTASTQNLHQLYVATMLYQSNWSPTAEYGYAHEMGFPSFKAGGSVELVLGSDQKHNSPCGDNPSWLKPGSGFTLHNMLFRPIEDDERFDVYARRYQQNLVLWEDINCDFSGIDYADKTITHRGLAVLYSGQLVKQIQVGDMTKDSWWSSPPDSDKP